MSRASTRTSRCSSSTSVTAPRPSSTRPPARPCPRRCTPRAPTSSTTRPALSGAGLFQAAAEKSKYAIGVDSDQYLTASAAEQKWIITSALKRVDTATYDTIKAVGDGSFKGGTQIFDLANDGVGFATSNPTLLTSDMVDAMEARSRRSSTAPSRCPPRHRRSGRAGSIRWSDDGAGRGSAPLVVLEDVTKRFPGVVANDDVSWSSVPGRSTRSSERTAPASRR